MQKALPRSTGGGSYPNCWGWQGTTLDGHRIEVSYYWGWDLRIELTTERQEGRKITPSKSWFYLARNDRDKAMYLFGQLTGLVYDGSNWYDIEERNKLDKL